MVQRVGRVPLFFSTTKPNLKTATPDEVKILMTNATSLSVSEVVELYSLRWQIELFFQELKSTLGFAQYRFASFEAVKAWVEIALTTVLCLPPRVRRSRTEIPRRSPQNFRRHRKTQTSAERSLTQGIPHCRLIIFRKSATSKLTLRVTFGLRHVQDFAAFPN